MMMFKLDVIDAGYDMSIPCRLYFTRHYKDTIHERLMILISFCSKFTGVQVCKKTIKIELSLTVIAKK